MGKKVNRELQVGMFIEMRVTKDKKIVVGFGNQKGGVYIDVPNLPEEMFEKAFDFAEKVLNQPDDYKGYCEYYDINVNDVDANVEEYVRKKQIKQMLEQMELEGKKKEEKQLKLLN